MTSILHSDSLQLPRLAAHPDAAPTGYAYLYILDSDGSVYIMDESGTEVELGSGGGGGGGATAFTDLTDVPGDYTSDGGKFLRVNVGETGLEYVVLPASFVESFLDLDDTPGSYSSATNFLVKVNGTGDGLAFVQDTSIKTDVASQYSAVSVKSSPSGGDFLLIEDQADSGAKKVIQIGNLPGSATNFTGLADAPSDYTGQANKLVAVNGDEDGLEFVDGGTGGASNFTDLGDVPSSYSGQSLKLVRVNSGETALEFTDPPSGGSGGSHALRYSQIEIVDVAETTSETSLIGTPVGPDTFPSDLVAGDVIRITAFGITYTDTTPYEFSFKAYIGNDEVCITNGLSLIHI